MAEGRTESMKLNPTNRKLRRIGLTLLVSAIVLIVVWEPYYAIGVVYPYRQSIGAYVDRAYDASDFAVMHENLVLAEQGMRAQGLLPTDCAYFFSWEQTPDHCMAFSYNYIDRLINRTGYYARLFAGLPNATLTDVYSQAMNNMRTEMLRNGPIDWLAWPAWLLKYHPLAYFSVLLWVYILPGLMLGFGLWLAGRLDYFGLDGEAEGENPAERG
jgi:hypothetical protein